jgi:hypothetical protein
MPLWATVTVIGIITSIGGFLLKYIVQIAGYLGAINQQLKALEEFRRDHEAEHVALRNDYWQRPAQRPRRYS